MLRLPPSRTVSPTQDRSTSCPTAPSPAAPPCAFAGIGGALTLGATACGPGGPTADGTTSAPAPAGTPAPGDERRLGAEWESHTRTFMSWPALTSVWEDDLPYVREDIARIARVVGESEAVVMMARPDQVAAAQRACGAQVEVVPLAVDDLWARDTVPAFVEDDGRVVGVDCNFNGWGDKQEHTDDGQVGRELLARYVLAARLARTLSQRELDQRDLGPRRGLPRRAAPWNLPIQLWQHHQLR